MNEKEFELWLKAGSQNKITQKNTWSATVIDYFDTATFEENNNLNFQKASSALDTCVKVYTTRVDDVSTSMNKLLDNFSCAPEVIKSIKEPKHKEKTHKKANTLVSDDGSIFLKDLGNAEFFDGYFTKFMKEGRGFLNLSMKTDGFFRIFSEDVDNLLFFQSDKEFNVSHKNKVVCPSFSQIEEIDDEIQENDESDEIEEEQVNLNNLDEELMDNEYDNTNDDTGNDYDYNYENENSNTEEEVNDLQPVLNKTWSGPNFWKLPPKKKYGNSEVQNKQERVKKIKKIIDFDINIDKSILFEPGNTVFDKETLKERRNERNMLPNDLCIQTDDLYKFLVRDDSFKHFSMNPPGDVSFGNDFGANNASFNNTVLNTTENKTFESKIIENDDEVKKSQESAKMDKESDSYYKNITNTQNVFKKINIIPKKIDMKRLKDNLFDMVESSKKKICLIDAYKNVVKKYSGKESKDLSVHYCVVSLLHLANEKNLQIEEDGKSFVISLNKK